MIPASDLITCFLSLRFLENKAASVIVCRRALSSAFPSHILSASYPAPSFWIRTRHQLDGVVTLYWHLSSELLTAKLEKDMNRRCSHCGHNGHNSRTCPDKGIKLFGVRLTEGVMRKSYSMGNLAHFNSQMLSSTPEHSESGAGADGYLSDGLVQSSSSARERKKGVPWTEEEHRMFLLGLHKLGKGDWRGISRNFVTTRTPTQVASHAQKYFLRQSNLNKRKRRSSLFDLPADNVASSMLLEGPLPKACDFALAVPELSLGTTSGHLLESRGSSNYSVSVGIMPIPSAVPLSLAAANLSLGKPRVISQNGGECGWSVYKDEEAYSSLHMAIPVSPSSSVSESSRASGSAANPCPSLPFALPLRPGLDSQGIISSLPSPPASSMRIAKATATFPATLARIDESAELPTLSLSIAPPSVESSPMSLKLDQASRHSAFSRTSSSITNGNISPNGSLTSAISVV